VLFGRWIRCQRPFTAAVGELIVRDHEQVPHRDRVEGIARGTPWNATANAPTSRNSTFSFENSTRRSRKSSLSVPRDIVVRWELSVPVDSDWDCHRLREKRSHSEGGRIGHHHHSSHQISPQTRRWWIRVGARRLLSAGARRCPFHKFDPRSSRSSRPRTEFMSVSR
jgi:hypothetical protein